MTAMSSLLQTCAVALIVGGCLGYALSALLPSAARRAMARLLLALPWPGATAVWLRKAAQAPASGCGCDGCDHKAAPQPARHAVQPLIFHRRPRTGSISE